MTYASDPVLESNNVPVNVGAITVGGNVEGDILIGNNNKVYRVTVNKQYGDVYNVNPDGPVVKRLDVTPQPPRPPLGFIGRSSELSFLEQIITEKKSPAFLYGHDGLGKSALLRQAANCDPARAMHDGVIYLEKDEETGDQLGHMDILQRVFNRLYTSYPPLKLNPDEAETRLGNVSPLVILDGFSLPESDYHKLAFALGKSALIVSDRKLSGREEDFEPYKLTPLMRKDSLQLLSAKTGIALDNETRLIMDRICKQCGDVPLALLRIAMLVREGRIGLEEAESKLAYIQPPSQDIAQAAIERSFAVVYPLLDTDEREVLANIAAAPGISVSRAWLESSARDPQAVTRLEALEVIQANSPRLRLSEGYRQVIYSTGMDLSLHRSNLMVYLLNRLRTQTPDFEFIANELGNILGLLKWAVAEHRWEEAIALGRAVSPYLTLKGLWDAGQKVLQQVLLAGQKVDDQVTQAWALHQLGSREIGAGTVPQAIKYLTRALAMRQALGDHTGAAYTFHNLKLILPLIDHPKPRIKPGWIIGGLVTVAVVVAAYLFARPPDTPGVPTEEKLIAPTPTMATCPMPEGWEIYIAQEGDTYTSIAQEVAMALDGEIIATRIPALKQAIKRANCTVAEMPELSQSVYVPATPVRPPILPSKESSIILGLSRRDETALDTVGQTIEYIYDIVNIGEGNWEVPPDFSIVDTKQTPITCPDLQKVGSIGGILAPGEKFTCTSTYNLNQTDIDMGTVTITAVAYIGDGVQIEESLALPVEQNPEITLIKQAEPAVYYQVEDVITYTYTIQNTGNVTLAPVYLTVKDNLLREGSYFYCSPETINMVAPKETVTCTESYMISSQDVEIKSVINIAVASVNGLIINILDSNEATTTVRYADPLTLEISASPEIYSEPGEIVAFTYTLTNINDTALPGPITGLEFANCPQFEVLAPNAPITCTEEYAVTQVDLDNGLITRLVSVSLGRMASPETTFFVPGRQIPRLTLIQSASPNSYNSENQTITYTYTIENTGNITLGPTQFTVNVELPNGSISFDCNSNEATIPPKDNSLTCTSEYVTRTGDVNAKSVTNKASASVVYQDSLISSDTVTSTVSFICPPPPRGWMVYIVQPDDNLSTIGSWYDLSTQRLQAANCLGTSTTIYSGQKLYVPSVVSINGKVFLDPDGDGEIDEGEAMLADLEVRLERSDGTIVRTTMTNADGIFEFTNLPPGEYLILQASITLPNNETIKFGLRPVP